jgi:Sulfotransferase family
MNVSKRLLAERQQPFLRALYAAARELTPVSLRKEFPDLFTRRAPSQLQRLSETLFDFPVPRSVRSSPLIFIHIPKNAGTTISTQLYGAHRGHRSALYHLRSDPQHFKSKISFAVVRNPWGRIVSAYEFGRTLNPNHRPFLTETRRVFAEYTTFEDFVLKYLWPNRADVDSLDPIFRHQSFYVCDCNGRILVDKIFRYENLRELNRWLSGFQFDLDLNMRINASSYTEDSVEPSHYRSYYRNELVIERVRQIYQRDVILFGYEY